MVGNPERKSPILLQFTAPDTRDVRRNRVRIAVVDEPEERFFVVAGLPEGFDGDVPFDAFCCGVGGAGA